MHTPTIDKLKSQIKNITGSNHRSKVALCLAGGGITGSMFEVGCLVALDEFFEEPGSVNRFDIFLGVSAGAIISTLVANGYSPGEIADGISENGKSPLNFKRKNIYNLRWSEFFASVAPLFKRLPSLIRYGWKHRKHATVLDLISIMQEFIPPGIFSLHNLDKFMAELLYPEGKTNDFRNLEKELYIPATNLDTAKRWIFGEDDKTVPISKAVAASAAVPLFFRPFRINGQDYIDGSTSQVAHVDIALRNGAKLVIVINPTVPIENDKSKICLPTFDGNCGSLKEKGMSFISDQARRIETQTRFRMGFERFKKENPDVDYIIIQPNPSDAMLFLHGVMDFDSRKLIFNYGYNLARKQLEENSQKYKEIFEAHNLTVSSRVTTAEK